MRIRSAVIIGLLLGTTAIAPMPSAAAAGAGCRSRQPDFDGDNRADLAVGVPGEGTTGGDDAGAIHVIYGSSTGLNLQDDQFVSQNTSGIASSEQAGESFGAALASGDFDGDGRDDIAVGVPFEDVSGVADAGAVNVIYGSAGGLTATGDQFIHQDVAGVADSPATNEGFGAALAACDFNNDGRDDLAIGVSFENVGGFSGAGAVHVLYGSSAGLNFTNDQFWHQNTSGVAGSAFSAEVFGTALTAGDFDDDGRNDLAVGVPGEDSGGQEGSGAVNVLYGSAAGITASGDQLFSQSSTGMADTSETEDGFGTSLAAGDFDNDGRDDLAVGVPFESITSSANGAVHVIYGTSDGLTSSGDALLHQDVSGFADSTGFGEVFGAALAAGDYNGDGRDDLAVGIPGQTVSGHPGAGAVHVIFGSSVGLSASGDQFLHQDTSNVNDSAFDNEFFGAAVSSGDFNGNGHDDLAVGVPNEPGAIADGAGAVNVLYGSSSGITSSGDQFINQDVTGLDATEPDDSFGAALVGSRSIG